MLPSSVHFYSASAVPHNASGAKKKHFKETSGEGAGKEWLRVVPFSNRLAILEQTESASYELLCCTLQQGSEALIAWSAPSWAHLGEGLPLVVKALANLEARWPHSSTYLFAQPRAVCYLGILLPYCHISRSRCICDGFQSQSFGHSIQDMSLAHSLN